MRIITSPEYVRSRPPLKTFNDLAEWDWIQNTGVPWQMMAAAFGEEVSARVPNIRMSYDNYTLARKFVDEGLGFTIETYPLVADDFRSGKLVHL